LNRRNAGPPAREARRSSSWLQFASSGGRWRTLTGAWGSPEQAADLDGDVPPHAGRRTVIVMINGHAQRCAAHPRAASSSGASFASMADSLPEEPTIMKEPLLPRRTASRRRCSSHARSEDATGGPFRSGFAASDLLA
jgi:hypothetical protein